MEHINYYYGDQIPGANIVTGDNRFFQTMMQTKGKSTGNNYSPVKTDTTPINTISQHKKVNQSRQSLPQKTAQKKMNTSRLRYPPGNPYSMGMKPKQPTMRNRKKRKWGLK